MSFLRVSNFFDSDFTLVRRMEREDAVMKNCNYYVDDKGIIEPKGLTISDGTKIETFCGTAIPNTLTRSGPVEITFSSDGNNGYNGFELDFSCGGATPPPITTTPNPTPPPITTTPDPTPPPNTTTIPPPTSPPFDCGGVLFPPAGKIKSPKSYPANVECLWEIKCWDGASPKLDLTWGDVTNTIGWGPEASCGLVVSFLSIQEDTLQMFCLQSTQMFVCVLN